MKAATFESYHADARNELALQKAKAFSDGQRSLYLFGSPGNGKSHLLKAAYQQALRQYCQHALLFVNVSRMLKIERDEYETREEAEYRLLMRLRKKLIIFLDDFCAEHITERTAEFIYILLNDAIENGNQRFFFTSNQSTIYINDNVSARIASRVIGLCGKENIVKIEGDDWRIKA